MPSITLSPKYQIVIPKDIRNSLQLQAGMKLEIICYNNRIELIPLRPIQELRGALQGIDTKINRENDRL